MAAANQCRPNFIFKESFRNASRSFVDSDVGVFSGSSAAKRGYHKDDKIRQAWDAKSIKWQDIDASGTKYALLEGPRDVPGEAFTYAFFIPAGYHEHHWHSADARVAVIQGALKVSFGETLDLEHMTPHPVGSFLLVPANVKHTMAADVDTIIIGTAVGPWATHHHGEHQHH